jgi:hypothetical protein
VMWRQNELQKKKKLSLESTTRDLIHWACSATRIAGGDRWNAGFRCSCEHGWIEKRTKSSRLKNR